MRLAEYLKREALTLEAFASKVGDVSFQSIDRYAKFQRWPERDIASRIMRITNGLVRPDDFLPGEESLPERTRLIIDLLVQLPPEDRDQVLRICRAFSLPDK